MYYYNHYYYYFYYYCAHVREDKMGMVCSTH